MTLMLQERITATELAARMGVDRQRVFRYLSLKVKGTHTKSAMTHRYPDQYLVELMLDRESRDRLIKLHAWES